MQRFSSRRLVLSLSLCAAVTAAQSACSDGPTSPQNEERPVLSTAVLLTVGGPAEIIRSGNYTYGARLGANYASFAFYTRSCPTLTVATCTSPWSVATGIAVIDPYTRQMTRYLTYTCALKAPKSFQVRVTASGFAVPQQTGYVVTKLCGELA
jgi:hypothetical protein